jgi:nitroreductase/FMN reductase (NADPH)/FMN reductase [NAD(P)H]
MNEILNMIFERRSTRAYCCKPVGASDKTLILQAALQAPTAGNMTLYSVIDVTDEALKKTLSVTCDNQPFIAKAPLVLIFVADMRKWYDAYAMRRKEARTPSYGDMMLACADALIAAQNATVAAESLGIGSCYIGDILERFEKYRALLNLPRYTLPAAMFASAIRPRAKRRAKNPCVSTFPTSYSKTRTARAAKKSFTACSGAKRKPRAMRKVPAALLMLRTKKNGAQITRWK